MSRVRRLRDSLKRGGILTGPLVSRFATGLLPCGAPERPGTREFSCQGSGPAPAEGVRARLLFVGCHGTLLLPPGPGGRAAVGRALLLVRRRGLAGGGGGGRRAPPC